MPFEYAASPHPVRADIVETHRETWRRIARPGSWWTGAERIAIAQIVRDARLVRADPPWLRGDPTEIEGLPAAAVDTARRIAIDAHKLDRKWCDEAVASLGAGAYVELVAVSVCVTAVDAFAEALGLPLEPLPAARGGEPDHETPGGDAEAGDVGAWVPLRVDYQGPNVGRALSLVPQQNTMFFGLVATMYAMADFTVLVWDRPLTRPQVELVAARVSAVNECFY